MTETRMMYRACRERETREEFSR